MITLTIGAEGELALPDEMLKHLGVHKNESAQLDVDIRPDRKIELKVAQGKPRPVPSR